MELCGTSRLLSHNRYSAKILTYIRFFLSLLIQSQSATFPRRTQSLVSRQTFVSLLLFNPFQRPFTPSRGGHLILKSVRGKRRIRQAASVRFVLPACSTLYLGSSWSISAFVFTQASSSSHSWPHGRDVVVES